MNTAAKVLFYPVVIVVTLLALMCWTDKPFWFSMIATTDALLLWALPLASKRRPYLVPMLVGGNLIILFVLLDLAFMSAAAP
jgi:hypothetical protein